MFFLDSSVVVSGIRVVFWVSRFSKKNANPFAVLSSACFGDAVADRQEKQASGSCRHQRLLQDNGGIALLGPWFMTLRQIGRKSDDLGCQRAVVLCS